MSTPDTSKIQEALKKAGLNENDFEITFEKKITIRKVREVTVGTVMPAFPELKPCAPTMFKDSQEKCFLCTKPVNQHRRLDYLVQPPHVQQIFEFFTHIQNIHDGTKSMYFKLATEAGSTVLTQKEMVLLLKELALQNPWLTNQFTRLFAYYIPAEDFHYQINNLSQRLLALITHFKALNRKYRLEYEIHQQNDVEFYGRHEPDAIWDYDDIQTRVYEVTARVLAYAKLVAEFQKLPRYGRMKIMAEKRRQARPPPTYVIQAPTSKRSRVKYE